MSLADILDRMDERRYPRKMPTKEYLSKSPLLDETDRYRIDMTRRDELSDALHTASDYFPESDVMYDPDKLASVYVPGNPYLSPRDAYVDDIYELAGKPLGATYGGHP